MRQLDKLLVEYHLDDPALWEHIVAELRLFEVSSEDLRLFVQEQIKKAEVAAFVYVVTRGL